MLCNSVIVLIYFYVQVCAAHSTFIESPTAECVSTSQWAFPPPFTSTMQLQLSVELISSPLFQAISQKPGLAKDPHRWLAETKVR